MRRHSRIASLARSAKPKKNTFFRTRRSRNFAKRAEARTANLSSNPAKPELREASRSAKIFYAWRDSNPRTRTEALASAMPSHRLFGDSASRTEEPMRRHSRTELKREDLLHVEGFEPPNA
uniref:Uncharacterized protein n=1 Tax=Pediastrum duplex TaxID=3105 RepID=A0A2U8GJH4_PEDDU|nr:hypothetical protein [Pediastrum duplex]AWI68451.1 hypothetical protein [Pediastrum duplex]